MLDRMSPSEARALIYGHFPMEDDSDPMVAPYNEAQGWVVQMGPDSYTNDMPDAPYEDAKILAHATRALRTIVAVGKVVDLLDQLAADRQADADQIDWARDRSEGASHAYDKAAQFIREALGEET